MPNAAKILILTLCASALVACHSKQQQSNDAVNQDLSIDDNMSAGQLPANTQVETLPPDESSEASNGELATGDDNPDVNEVRNSH